MRRGEKAAWRSDAQGREERRAEARLAQGLRRLDEACLYHLSTLTREQRRLCRDLGALRTGNSWKRSFSDLQPRPWGCDLNQPVLSYKRTVLPRIPCATRLDKHCSREQKPTGTAGSSSGLQARIRDFVTGGEPQWESSMVPVSLPDLRGKTGSGLDTDDPNKTRRQSERNVDTDAGTSTEGDVAQSPSTPPLARPLAPDGRLRTVHTFPSFPQALAEARKARYLRHRGQPLSERELSVGEIFGRTPYDSSTYCP
ncbi:coiled-coil domain-containing protein 190 [Brienomyrus brachyistius]|uniref:coiled-coil domain-containing protein 190 n=1 Tax=Brienomyrus brachyistius TaxID=42636 RepID=UPI0020B18FEC|nr:coiled-coil domain-containing protein 190 [Brienomyrus brachyistius]XP_048833382.1 coiled-coil domain-containing protein 190 [Brienomyrus brachyistius]XP_048833383.1 coiled-coil domain-containing protein 190 [Brienomyrus brachyistius]XP_048833384.1 coiled-coil domain-containing protein 190 [Brienomyrus brachyistius]XP_048833385.1 coiled-coil domain-containing protein 190 [Brienomyrus brachyistius]